jgi:hypothetical protein
MLFVGGLKSQSLPFNTSDKGLRDTSSTTKKDSVLSSKKSATKIDFANPDSIFGMNRVLHSGFRITYKTFTKHTGKLRVKTNALPSVLDLEFLIGLLLLGIVIFISPGYMLFLWNSFVQRDALMDMYENGRFGFNLVNTCLDLICILALSINVQYFLLTDDLRQTLWTPVFVMGFYYLRMVLIQILGIVFMDADFTYNHLFRWLHFSRAIGPVFLVVTFLLIHQSKEVASVVSEFVPSAYLLCAMLYSLLIMRVTRFENLWQPTYIFLYLCTAEISPVLILAKAYIR